MKNYLIVTDTTSAMNSIQAKEYGVELVSLSVLIDRIETNLILQRINYIKN